MPAKRNTNGKASPPDCGKSSLIMSHYLSRQCGKDTKGTKNFTSGLLLCALGFFVGYISFLHETLSAILMA